MEDEFSQAQKELFKKPTIIIEPAFDNMWTVECFNQDGQLEGRAIVDSAASVVMSIRAALLDVNGPPHFEVN